jgi:dTMP kinase
MTRGKFITLEGGEGAGKSTQARLLADWLGTLGIATLVTREPGGSPLAERIRGLLLDPDIGPKDALAEALLFNAARRDHVLATIAPALAAGTWVICDRYSDSTRAYQGAGERLAVGIVAELEHWVTADARPDATLILDMPAEAGLARAAARHAQASSLGQGRDRFEAADLAFHRRLRDAFRAIAADEPERCVLIDAAGPVEAVAAALHAAIADRLLP